MRRPTPPPTPHSHAVLAGQMGGKTGYFDTWNIRLNIQLFSCGGCWRGSAVAQKTCQYQMAQYAKIAITTATFVCVCVTFLAI